LNPEVHEVVIGIQAHVAIDLEGGWDGSADALVIRRGFHGPGGHVGEEFGEIDLENLPWSASADAANHTTTARQAAVLIFPELFYCTANWLRCGRSFHPL
jgi:hypothetical protein